MRLKQGKLYLLNKKPKVGALYKVVRNYPPSCKPQDTPLWGLYANKDIIFMVTEVDRPTSYGVKKVKIYKIKEMKIEELNCTDKEFFKCFERLI